MIKLRPACLLLCILCHNYVYTNDVPEQSRYTTQYTNGKQTIPQISDTCLGDDSISFKICSCTQNLHKSKIISLAGCDEQIYQIIKDIQIKNIKKDITIIFYLYKNGKLYYLGSSMTSLVIFEMVLRKYNHYICINEENIHKFHEAHAGWSINDIILIPSHKESLMLNDLVKRYGNNYLDYDTRRNNFLTSESSQDKNKNQNFIGHLKDDVNHFVYYEYDVPTNKNLVSLPINLISNEKKSPKDGNEDVFDSKNLEGYRNQICLNNWYDTRNDNNVLQASTGNVKFGSGADKGLNLKSYFNRYTEKPAYDNYCSYSICSPAAVKIFDGDLSTIAQIPSQLSESLPLYYSISNPVNYFEQKICKFNKPSADLDYLYKNRPYQDELSDSKVYYFNGERQHYTSYNINTIIPIKSLCLTKPCFSTSSPKLFANIDAYNGHSSSDISQTSNAAKHSNNYYNQITLKPDILTPALQLNPISCKVNINNPTQQELINGNVLCTENRIFDNNLLNYYLYLKPVDYKGKNINIDIYKEHGTAFNQQKLAENHQFNNNWFNYYLNFKPVNYQGMNININKKHIPILTRQRPTNENVFFAENRLFDKWQSYYLNIKPVNYKGMNINIGLVKEQSPTSTLQNPVNKNILFTENYHYNSNWPNYYLNLKPVDYKGMNININLYQDHNNPPKIQNPDYHGIHQNNYLKEQELALKPSVLQGYGYYKPCNWYKKYFTPNMYGFNGNGYNIINTYDHNKNKCYEFDLSRHSHGTRGNLPVNSKILQSALITPLINNIKSKPKLADNRNYQSYQNNNEYYSFPSQHYKAQAITAALFTKPSKSNQLYLADGNSQPYIKYKSNIPNLDMSQNIQNGIYPMQNEYYPTGNQNYFKPALATSLSVQPVRYYPSHNYMTNTLPQSYAEKKTNMRVPQDKQTQIDLNLNEYNPKVCQNNYETPSNIIPFTKINDITQNNVQNPDAISQPFARLKPSFPKQFISPQRIPSYEYYPKLFQNPATNSPVLHSNNFDNQPGLISNAQWPNFARVNARLPNRQNDNVNSETNKVFNRPTDSTARLIENNANDNNMSTLKPNFISYPSTQLNVMPDSLNQPQNLYSNGGPTYNGLSVALLPNFRLNDEENICKAQPNNPINPGLRAASLVASIPPNTVPMYSSKVVANSLPGSIAVTSDKLSGYSLNNIPVNTNPPGPNYYVPGNKLDSIFKLSDKNQIQNYTPFAFPYDNLSEPQNLIAQAANKYPDIKANNLLAYPDNENYNNFGNNPYKQEAWPSYPDKFIINSASYLPTGGTKTKISKTKPQFYPTQFYCAQTTTPYPLQLSHVPYTLNDNKNDYDPNKAPIPTKKYNAYIQTKIPSETITPLQYLPSSFQSKIKTSKISDYSPQVTPFNSNIFWNRPYKFKSIPDVKGISANNAAYNLLGLQNNNINMPFTLNPKNNYYSDIPSYMKPDQLINRNNQPGLPIDNYVQIKDTLKDRVNSKNDLPNIKFDPSQLTKTPAVFNFKPFIGGDDKPKTVTSIGIYPYLPNQNPYFNDNYARPFGSSSKTMPSILKLPCAAFNLNGTPQTQPYKGFPNLKPSFVLPRFKSQSTAHSYPSTATYSSPSSYSSPTPYLPKQNPYYSVRDNKAFETTPHVIKKGPYIDPYLITLPNKAQTRNFADVKRPFSSSRSQNIAHSRPFTATLPSPSSYSFQIPSYIPQIEPCIKSQYSPTLNTPPDTKSPATSWPLSPFDYQQNPLELSRKTHPRQYILDLSHVSPRFANRYKPQSSVNTWPCFTSDKFNYPLGVKPTSLLCTNWKGSIKSNRFPYFSNIIKSSPYSPRNPPQIIPQIPPCENFVKSKTIPRILSPDTLNTPRSQIEYSNLDSSTRLPNKNIQSQPDLSLLALQKPYQKEWPSLSMIKPQLPTINKPYLNIGSSVYPSYTQLTLTDSNLIKPRTSITDWPNSALYTSKYPSVIAPPLYPCTDFGKSYTSPCSSSTDPNSFSTQPNESLDRFKPSNIRSHFQPYSSNFAYYYNSPGFSASAVTHLPCKPYSQEIPSTIPQVQPWTRTGDLTGPWSYPEFSSLNTKKPQVLTASTPATDMSDYVSDIIPQSKTFKYLLDYPKLQTNIWPQSYSFNFKPFTGFSVPKSTIMPGISNLNKKKIDSPVTNSPHLYTYGTKYPQFNSRFPQSAKLTTFPGIASPDTDNLQSPVTDNIKSNLLGPQNLQSFTKYSDFVQPSLRFANLNTVTPKLQTSTLPYSAFYSPKYPSNITQLSLSSPYYLNYCQPFVLPKHTVVNLEKPQSAVPIHRYSSPSLKYPSDIAGITQPKSHLFDRYYPSSEYKYPNILVSESLTKDKPYSTLGYIQTHSVQPLSQPSNYLKGFTKSDVFSNPIKKPSSSLIRPYSTLYSLPKSSTQYGVDYVSNYEKNCKSPEQYHQDANKPQLSTTVWPCHTAKSSIGQTFTSPVATNDNLVSYNAKLKYSYPKTTPAPFDFNFNKYDSYQMPIRIPNTILKYSFQHPIKNSDKNLKKINMPFNSFTRPFNKFSFDSANPFYYKPPINEAVDSNNHKHLQYTTPVSLETNNIYPIISSNIGAGTLNVSPYSLQTNQVENFEYPNIHAFRGPLPVKCDYFPKIRNSISKPNLFDNKYTFDMSKYFPKASQFDYDLGFTPNYNVNNVQKLDHPPPNYDWQLLPKINQPISVPNVYEGKPKLYPDQVHFASNNKIHAIPENLHLAFNPPKNSQKYTLRQFPINPFNKPRTSEFYKMTSFPGICNLQAPKVQSPTKSPYQLIYQPNIPHNTAKIEPKPFVPYIKVFNKPISYTATSNNVGIGTTYKTQMYSQKYPQIDNYDTKQTSIWNRPIHFEQTPNYVGTPNTAQTPCILNRYSETTSNYFRPYSYGSNVASPMNGQGEYMPKLSSRSQNVIPQILPYLSPKLPNQYTGVFSGYKSPLKDYPQQYISYKATLQPSTMEYSPSKIIIPSGNYLSNKKYSDSYTIPEPRNLNQRFNYNMLNPPYQTINTNTGIMTYSPTVTKFNTKLEKSETTPSPYNNDVILNQSFTNVNNLRPCVKTNYATNYNIHDKMPQVNDNKMYKQTPSEIQSSYNSGVMSNNYNPISAFNLCPILEQPKNTSYKSSYPNICANNFKYLWPRPNYNDQYKIPNLSTVVTNKPEIIFNEPQITAQPAGTSKLNSVPETKIRPISIQNSYFTSYYPRYLDMPLNTAKVANMVPHRNLHPCHSMYSISKGADGLTPCSYSITSTPVSKSTAGLANMAFTPPFLYSPYPQSSNNVPSTNFNLETQNLYPANAAQTIPTTSVYPYNWFNYKPNIKLQNNIIRFPSTSPRGNGIAHFINQYRPFTDNNNDPINDVHAERFAINNLLECHPQNKINNDCQIAENLLKDKHVDVDVGNVCLVKNRPDCTDNTYIVPTKQPGIFMKAWRTKMKIIKARVVFDESECSVTNFMPIVKDSNKFDFGAVQNIVKDVVTQTYGEPVVLKGEYRVHSPYSIICNIDVSKLNPGTSILWPTLDENII